ncbi:hypothetical protein HOC37_05620 [bacterium]|jgi:hypothetical protein|nr:hypothetical protein [bacterium]MBT3580874.1 hypothetical protein [bacterium]MBT4552440.1 hypothetical protein [bacterium]MBT7087578.1 hypothetical protein [bacterium]
MTLENKFKRKIKQKDSQKLVGIVKEFNKLAKEFINILNTEIDEKEKKINVLLDGLPKLNQRHNINIQTLDLGNTKGVKRGEFSGNITHKWEKDVLSELKRKIII